MPLRLIIQFLVLLIGVLFESVRTGQGQIYPFFLVNESEWYRSFVYNICEHLKFITISVLMWKPDVRFYKTDRLFVMLAIADFIDYFLTGNNLWARIDLIPAKESFGWTLPLSMNTVTFFIFGIAILKHEQ